MSSIIPFARGKVRSKEPNVVIEEIKKLVECGHKEVVLTGIHTGHYGADLKDYSFSKLLKEIEEIDGLKRLRISSIEITELDEEFMNVLENSKILVDHMHIPIQSGSDTILKLMNRKYDKDYFINRIKEIRKIRPNISITTDIIVGFPGETEELFQETLAFARKIKFTKIHVFPYSRRAGTKADLMENQVLESIKKERVKRLINLGNQLEREYLDSFIGKQVLVLVETNDEVSSIGHTGNYLKVCINSKVESNQIVKVQIEKRDDLLLEGTRVR